MQYPEPIAKLIDSYMKLPGIGQKTATRLAFYTIDMKDEVVNEFAKSLLSVKRDLHFLYLFHHALHIAHSTHHNYLLLFINHLPL